MAKTFTSQISERTQEIIVLCKMAEELNSRFAELSHKYGKFSKMILDAEDDITTVCNDIAFILEDSISDDRRLDR